MTAYALILPTLTLSGPSLAGFRELPNNIATIKPILIVENLMKVWNYNIILKS
jgi:hypothetical protein